MRNKPAICEIVQNGKVLESIACRYFLKIEKFVAQVNKKKGPVTLRCPYCHGPLAWIASSVVNGLGYELLQGVQVCPVCFPGREAAQEEAILEKINRPPSHYRSKMRANK